MTEIQVRPLHAQDITQAALGNEGLVLELNGPCTSDVSNPGFDFKNPIPLEERIPVYLYDTYVD